MNSGKRESPRLLVYLLLSYIVVVAIVLWFIDLLYQQRVFGFLLSSELVAFSILVYLYRVESTNEYDMKLNKQWVMLGVAAIAVLVLLSLIVSLPSPSPKPNITITMYEGEISATRSGFGFKQSNLTSPGPTLTFTIGDVVNITVYNVGQEPHNWAIVSANQSSAAVLFKAQVRTVDNALQHGGSDWDVFTISQSGNFFYICQVPGHLEEDGMWGRVIANP